MHAVAEKLGGKLSDAVPQSLRAFAANAAQQVLERPFMLRCVNGTITMAELRLFLVQQGLYSAHFTRFLCALISNLRESGDVAKLASNLAEELGYGAPSERPHALIYSDMLGRFDLKLAGKTALPATTGLIETMSMLCRQPEELVGLGALCLGAEAIVPALYGRVLQGFAAHGVGGEDVEFFRIHVECDDGHAQTMFEIAERLVEGSELCRQKILSAGQLAIDARIRFFDALTQEQTE